jgi:hypothetical protein
MMEFEPALAFVKNEIEREIQGRPMVPEGFLIEFVQTRSGLAGMMDDQLKEKLVKYLETYFWTESTNGHSLSIGFDSWFQQLLLGAVEQILVRLFGHSQKCSAVD